MQQAVIKLGADAIMAVKAVIRTQQVVTLFVFFNLQRRHGEHRDFFA